MRGRLIASGGLAVGALLLAACSSGGTSATGKDSGGSGSSEKADAAKSRIADYLHPATKLTQSTPLSKKPDAGKKIVWLQCSQSSCQVIGTGVQQAAAKLGWSVKRIDFSNTDPESIISAMNQAVDSKPDAIALSGVPSERYETALARAKAAKIPVITGAVIDTVGGMSGNGIIGLVGGTKAYEAGGGIVADWVIADSNAKAHVLVVTANDFPIIKFEGDAVVKHIEDNCPDCKVTRLNQAVADIATNTPTNVVSALQQDPSINYVYFGFGDLSRGVAPAIKTAGVKAKVVGLAPVAENFQRVQDGEEAAWASWATALIGWGQVDGLARYFNGDSLDAANNQPLTFQLFTAKENPPPNTNPFFPANYQDLFAALWKAS